MKIEWTVTEANGEVTRPKGNKHPYVAPFKMTTDMSDGQRSTVETINSMRQMLLDNGLMHKK